MRSVAEVGVEHKCLYEGVKLFKMSSKRISFLMKARKGRHTAPDVRKFHKNAYTDENRT